MLLTHDTIMKISKKLLFFLPVIAGIALFVFQVSNKKQPTRSDVLEESRTVHVIETRLMTVTPTVIGYGYVQPTESWEALPEVAGKIIEMHPELKKGAFIAKGALLVRIDPQSYGLAASRGVASVMNIEAQLKELAQEKANTQKLLQLEQQKLKLSRQELTRKKELFNKGFVSASELEQEERNLLAQQGSVDSLQNNLKLIPAKLKSLEAQKEADISSLTSLKLDVEKTEIRAPFDCRIAEVNVELNQFTPVGASIIKAINISAIEIPVQLSPNSFANLLSPKLSEQSPILDSELNMDKIRELIGISATVSVPLFSKEATWQGKFMRTSDSIDLETGAITAFVSVAQPYEKIIPSIRPPLVPNLYAQVELSGSPRENRTVVPLHAIHDGDVFIVDQNSRLLRSTLKVEMIMGDFAIVSDGIASGTVIVTTDLVPAIEGMLVTPVIDKQLTDSINSLQTTE